MKNKNNRFIGSGSRSFDYLYINIPIRWIADLLAGILEKTFITPNMITYTGIILSIFFLFVVFFVTEDKTLYTVLDLFLISIFFALDGSLARKKKMKTVFGAWLGPIGEQFENAVIGLSLCIYAYYMTNNIIVVFLCFCIVLIYAIISVLYYFTLAIIPHAKKKIFEKEILVRTSFITILKRVFTFGGHMYILSIIIIIIFKFNVYLILFFVLYSSLFLILAIFKIGDSIIKEYKLN